MRKPSKNWRNGTIEGYVERCATSAMSISSWTEFAASMANPVLRHAITSEWSPKMARDWHASERAVTWKTVGSISPAILYMLGIIRRSPWEAV